ncbi:MAG: hypothetical protein PHS31_03680, partial [Victivallaceae bacterium]|nr:hypothetical protein [Victivallaceae bacterium]
MSNETKYQYTRAIRFKLNPCGDTDKKIKPVSNGNLKLIDLINALAKIKNDLEDIIYCQGRDGEKTENLNAKIKVKYTWLRSYLKNDFYDNRKDDSKIKSYAIADLNYVKNELETRWLIEWQSIINELRYQNIRPNEDLTRKPDIALVISRCLQRTNFEFIKEFVLSFENINDNLELDAKVNTLKDYLKSTGLLLTAFRNEYLPYQSQGVLVAGGSFNYYTVNKTSKMNLDSEKKKCESELAKKNKISLQDFNIAPDFENLSLDEAYNFLKKWKAERKSAFLEKAQKNELSYTDIEENSEFFLFNSSRENFDTFLKLSREIEEYATERNNKQTIKTRKEELKDLIISKKQKRGNFFNPPKSSVQTKNYKNVCEYFKKIALKRGQILAKIKGIEKETHAAEQINHWCFIVEKQNKQFLYMIPRTGNDNLQNVKAYIDKIDQREDQVNRTGEKLHFFESLTLPALRKLCFKEVNNTFAPAMKSIVKFPEYEQALDEQGKIRFYQNVLRQAQKSGSSGAG